MKKYDTVIFTFGKLSTLDTLYKTAHGDGSMLLKDVERYIDSPDYIEPADGERKITVGINESETKEFTFMPITGKRDGKQIVICPVESRVWKRKDGKIVESSIRRIREYSTESDKLIGVGYLGQHLRRENPPGRYVIPTEVHPTRSLIDLGLERGVGLEKGKLHNPIQDELDRLLGGNAIRQKTHCVFDPEDPETMDDGKKHRRFKENDFYGQEMEAAGLVYQAKLVRAKAGAIFVSFDPQVGDIFRFMTNEEGEPGYIIYEPEGWRQYMMENALDASIEAGISVR